MSATDVEKEEKVIDLDDPRLRESQTYDPEADAQRFITPPELDENGNAKDYQIKLSIGENKPKKAKKMYFKEDKNGNPFGIVRVEARIVDPGGLFDNAKLNDMYPNTMVNKQTKASQVTNLARVVGSPMPQGLSLSEQAEYIENLLVSEPLAWARIQWSAYCSGCVDEQGNKGRDVLELLGERKWPEEFDKDGKKIGHKSLTECGKCGTELTPKVSVKRFLTK